MDLYTILSRLAYSPESVKTYHDLQAYYTQSQKTQEAEAIGYLIEMKFGKNATINGSDTGEGQSESNTNLSRVSERA